MKLFTRILATIIEEKIPISEEQQGFRRNISTTDAIFAVRQIIEKSIEFDKLAFMCFVDLEKAFDLVRLSDIIKILKEKEVPEDIIGAIIAMNTCTSTHIMVNGSLTREVPVSTGIRQGDSLSPLLFNLVMDTIIEEVRSAGYGFRMDKGVISIVCYADDALLVADNEDDLQRLLYRFHLTSIKYNMKISAHKTKSLVVAKNPIRCKLTINDQMIEQVMSFKYLGIEITYCQDRKTEVVHQTMKAARIAGCLRELVWNNK